MTGEWEMATTNPEDWKPGGQAYKASKACEKCAESMMELHRIVTPVTRFDREKDVYQLTHGSYHFRLAKGFSMMRGSER